MKHNKIPTARLAARIRLHAVNMTSKGKSSHIGSILSIADILSVLYGKIMTLDPDNPKHPDRDRFILSKGHAGAGVYAALAETGFFDTTLLTQHYQNGSIFSGHVSHKGVPGVEFSTGSLGHGLGIGVGMAKAAKLRNDKHNIYVLLSDGECDEGSNWEALMFAAHHNLGNLTATIDYNKIQSLASTHETLNLEPFVDKLTAFGWQVLEADGHSHSELIAAYETARKNTEQPSVVLCHTTKGKGVSFMENSVLWHYRTPQGDEYKAAIEELKKGSDTGYA